MLSKQIDFNTIKKYHKFMTFYNKKGRLRKMKKLKAKEIFSIPNIMCYFRIILIPVFCYMYLTAETGKDYIMASMVVLLSSLTDLFDGMVARKFNMITELGKILDPVADKLSHAALALCLAFRYPLMWALLSLMAVKEGYMAIMGIKYLKKGKMMDGAMWFGKICTASLFVGLMSLFLIYNMPVVWVNTIIIVLMIIMTITLLMYIPVYKKFKTECSEEESK